MTVNSYHLQTYKYLQLVSNAFISLLKMTIIVYRVSNSKYSLLTNSRADGVITTDGTTTTDGTITGGTITDGTITGGTITGGMITGGTTTDGTITDGTITGATMV